MLRLLVGQAQTNASYQRQQAAALREHQRRRKGFNALLKGGLKLIASLRSNMKNKLMAMKEKLLLKKWGVIEAVIDILKSVRGVEHTHNHSPSICL